MFGYIKPDKENLLVKDLALYKAAYCGLCKVTRKNISVFLPLTLSYDFVFLAIVRAAIKGKKSAVNKGRCVYNPLKKCGYAICEDETLFVARAALLLTMLKLEDDLKDKDAPFYKRIIERPFHMHLSSQANKLLKHHNEYGSLLESMKESLLCLSRSENERSNDIDRACEIFGDMMAKLTAFSLDGSERAVAEEIGTSIGRYVYLIDAIDDVEKDEKSGSYNPLLEKYGSVNGVKKNLGELDIALSMFIKRAKLAADLLDSGEYTRIIDNILSLGMGLEAYKIMTENGDK